MKEIAIYGGAFNPPTVAHKGVVERCLAADMSEVWVIPSADRFDKQFDIDDNHRIGMLELMLGGHENIRIDRIELDELSKPTETRKTYQELKRRYPAFSFRFVFGSDAYNAMPTWNGGQALQSELPMLVIPRFSEVVIAGKNIRVLDPIGQENVSSTEVKRRIVEHRPLNGLVCPKVQRYIKEHKLYY